MLHSFKIIKKSYEIGTYYCFSHDKLTMYDGSLETSPIIGEYCDSTPPTHMDIGRYFGEVHLGLHPGEEDKRQKGEGWYYGRVTSMWVGQQAEDKGVQYYRITYDDGDTEDLERGEVRKIIS